MDNQEEQEEIVAGTTQELTDGEVQSIVPEMPAPLVVQPTEKPPLVTDDEVKDLTQEAKELIASDRAVITDLVEKFADMVINGGDASPSSKETLRELVKAQADQTDKLLKILDLQYRAKLKEQNTISDGLMARIKQTQNNTINVNAGKRASRMLIDAIHQNMKPKKGKDENAQP